MNQKYNNICNYQEGYGCWAKCDKRPAKKTPVPTPRAGCEISTETNCCDCNYTRTYGKCNTKGPEAGRCCKHYWDCPGGKYRTVSAWDGSLYQCTCSFEECNKELC